SRRQPPRVIVLEWKDRQRERRIVKLAIQLLKKFIDHRVVIDRGGDEKSDAARVWDDHRFVALHVWGLRSLVTLIEEVDQGRTHIPRIGIREWHEPNLTAQGRRRLVQLPGERFD